MRENWLPSDNRLDNQVFHLVHEQSSVTPFAFEVAQNCAQGPLVPLVSIEVLALLVSVRVFVEREVRQVHEYIVFVVFGRSGVALRAEASESHLMQVDPQRLNTVQQNIQS